MKDKYFYDFLRKFLDYHDTEHIVSPEEIEIAINILNNYKNDEWDSNKINKTKEIIDKGSFLCNLAICNSGKLSEEIIEYYISKNKHLTSLFSQKLSEIQLEKIEDIVGLKNVIDAIINDSIFKSQNSKYQIKLDQNIVEYFAIRAHEEKACEENDVGYKIYNMIENKEIAERIVNDANSTELELNGIINNPNVSVKLKEKAFERGCIYEKIDFNISQPLSVFYDVYQSFVDTYMDKSRSLDTEQLMLGYALLESKYIPQSCQIDFLMRFLKEKTKKSDPFLEAMIKSTRYKEVIEKATELKNNCEKFAYENQNITEKLLKHKMDELYKKIIKWQEKEERFYNKKPYIISVKEITDYMQRVHLNDKDVNKLTKIYGSPYNDDFRETLAKMMLFGKIKFIEDFKRQSKGEYATTNKDHTNWTGKYYLAAKLFENDSDEFRKYIKDVIDYTKAMHATNYLFRKVSEKETHSPVLQEAIKYFIKNNKMEYVLEQLDKMIAGKNDIMEFGLKNVKFFAKLETEYQTSDRSKWDKQNLMYALKQTADNCKNDIGMETYGYLSFDRILFELDYLKDEKETISENMKRLEEIEKEKDIEK